MTPEEHIAEAERLIQAIADRPEVAVPEVAGNVIGLVIAHALIALAVEAGVPHVPTPGQV